MERQFYCKVYKADGAFYQDGLAVPIHCRHDNLGVMGMNTKGELVPIEGSAFAGSPPVVVQVAMVPEGTIYPSPTAFADAGFKSITQVKDTVTLSTYYCDTADYNLKVVNCNPVG